MIEKPPKTSNEEKVKAIFRLLTEDGLAEVVQEQNANYAYWTDVKYKHDGFNSAEELWALVKASRQVCSVMRLPQFGLHALITSEMNKMCRDLDLYYGGTWVSDIRMSQRSQSLHLVSSVMEEAIWSSQMEGASTTRRVAMEMLASKKKPKDRSETMIANNFAAINFIMDNKANPLTKDLILHLHSTMTSGTLDMPEYEGRFRDNDDVVVANGITDEIVHIPPKCEKIEGLIDALCNFINNDNPAVYIHPAIKAIVAHFVMSYVHPFIDGNGRTARAIFYWCMLKDNYWLLQYLSISGEIARSKRLYEKAFLQSEADGGDIGYFIMYHLRVIRNAFARLQDSLKREDANRIATEKAVRTGLNDRQANILGKMQSGEFLAITARDVESLLNVSHTTARADLDGLAKLGLLEKVKVNKVKSRYILPTDSTPSPPLDPQN